MSQLSKAYEKNKKIQQSIASNLQEDEPKKQLTTVSMTSSKQQLKQVLQEQKQREKNPVQRKNTKIGASQSPKFVSTTFISPVQPIVRTQPSSNLQRLLAKVETDNSWYSGSTPTRSEAAARIYTISQTDPERARKLNQAFSQLQRDPSSQFYNPYGAATNKAIQELANLGVDMSGGITEDWLAKNSWLKAYYRTSGNSGTPLAPTKNSTAEQNAAYYYYQILKAQDTTNQAEAEWKALQEEIGYWANRKDRNYSDDQIISRIDWSKYKTLARMDDGAASGVPLTLNSAIGYSQDALKGVIWAARNGSTGNPLADSAKAVLGAGKTWHEDKKISAKLDPSSKAYSPYSVGSTLDDAALYFGVDSFSRDWLENNRSILAGNDATAKKMYQTVYNAEQTTLKAEQELDELHANIDRYLESTTDPDQILRMIDGEYKTLDSLDESMREGKLIGTTRAIDYRKQDIEFEVRRRCLAKNTQINGADYVGAVWKLLGLPEVKAEAGSAVGASRDNAINAGGATIADAGTDEEKTVFKTAYSSDFDTYLTQIKGAMDSGVSDPQGGYDYTLKRADQYAAENYMDAMDTVLTYEEAQQAKDEAIKKLNDLGVVYDEDGNIDMTNRKGSLIVPGADTAMAAAGMSDAPRKLRHESTSIDDEIFMLREEIETGYGEDEDGERVRLTDEEIKIKKARLSELQNPSASQKEINQLLAVVDESTETMERTQKSYDKANITLKNITEGYAVADRMQALTGAKAGDNLSTLNQMNFLFNIAQNYQPTEYRAANLYSLAMEYQGYSYEETAAAAKQGMEQNKAFIERVNLAVSELEKKGANLPDDKLENIQRFVAALERDIKDAQYFLEQENADFEQVASDEAWKIGNAYADYNTLSFWAMNDHNADRDGYTKLDDAIMLRLEEINIDEHNAAVDYTGPRTSAQAAAESDDFVGPLPANWVLQQQSNDHHIAMSQAAEGQYSNVLQLNKEECQTYLYIRATEGVDAAQEYYDHLTDETYGVINMRRNLAWTANMQKLAEENPVGASVLSVITSPLQIGGLIETAKAKIQGKEINPYAPGFAPGSMNSAMRGTVEENLVESVGGGFLGWTVGALYNAGMSIADSVYNSLFMGGIGLSAGSAAASGLAKAGITNNLSTILPKVVQSAVTASGQGLQAVSNAVMDAKLRGATDAEAMAIGGVTFVAETLTEAIEVDTIDSAIHRGAEREFKNFISETLFSMLNEGAGEGASEIIESVADTIIMGAKSNYDASVQQHMAEGMTKEQAEKAAIREIAYSALEATAVGAISGGLGTAYGYVRGDVYGDVDRIQQPAQTAAENVQQTAQETVQDVQQEQTAQDAQEAPTIAQEAQNAEVENVAPDTAEAAQTPNTKEETKPFDTGERLTQYEVNEKTVRQVTALTASLEADEASQTATIGAALLGENATPQETAFASAAAQHMTDTLGSDAAVRFTRDVLLLDSDTNGVRAALTVAALNKGGNASQVAQRMAQDGVTAEGIQELKAAADLDVQDANVTAQMQQTVQENQVAKRTAQLIGDGALKAVQPYETAVAQAKSVLRQAQGELRRQVKRREGLGQNLLSLQEQINSGTATPQLLDTFRSTVKDIEGQIKVVNEYTQRVANAEQSLHDAQNQLDTVRDDTLRQVRQQAQQDVMSTWDAQMRVDSNAAQAYNDTSEVSDNAVQHRIVDQSQAADAGQLAESSGRDDGRRDYLYAGQGAGRGADSGGAEGATRDIGQDNSGVYARLRVLSPNARNNLTQRGVTDLHLQEGQDQQRFSDALNAAKASNDHGAYVDAQSVEQLTEKGAKLIVSEDGLAGAAVATTGKEKGNIFAVFKDAKSTARGASAELLIQAIAEGGNKLDCYAGKLAAMYAKIGMEPVARVAFNEEFMPDGWNTERDDHPDIIFWKHNGDSADTVAQKYGLGESEGGYHVYTTEELNSLPLFDDVTDANGETQYGYDRAWDYRDSLIDAEVMQNETAGQGNDQSVQASYGVPGVTSTGKSGTAGAVVSPIVTAQNLAKSLGVGMTLGTRKMDTGSTKIPKAVRGYYEQNAKYIAVRSNEASSYAVTMHEAGHAIADKIGLTGTQEMVDRLNPVFAKNYNAQQLPGEAFAEFVRLYMTSKDLAADFAGRSFVQDFESKLRKAGIADAVHEAALSIQAYTAANTLDRVKAAFTDKVPKKGSLGERLAEFITNVQSWSYPLEQVDKLYAKEHGGEYGNVRMMAKQRNFAQRLVANMFTPGGHLVGPDRAIHGDSYSSCFNGVDGKNYEDFIAYWGMNHAIDRAKTNKQVFGSDISTEQMAASIAELDAAHPEYREAMDKAVKWWQDFMQLWMVDTGYLTQEQMDAMNQTYQHYMPTQRERIGGAKTGKSDFFQVRAAVGSDLRIVNPLISIADYANSIVGMNLKNDAALEFHNAFQSTEGMGIWAREITQDMRKTAVNTEDVQQQVNEILGAADVDTDVIGDVLNAIGKEAVSWQGTGTSSEGNVMSVHLPDGSNVYYQFTDDGKQIYDALTGNGKAGNASVNKAVRAFAGLTRFMSKMVTQNSWTFALTNPMRDFQTAAGYGTFAKSYVMGMLRWGKTFMQVARNAPIVQDYKAMGGGGWTRVDTNTRVGTDAYLNDMFDGYWKRNAKSTAKHYADKLLDIVTLEKLQGWVETTTRVLEYSSKAHDRSTKKGRIEAFQAAQDVSVDFAEGGKGAGVVVAKAFIPFLNPQIQGTARAVSELSGRERSRLKERMIKRGVNIFVTTAMAAVLRKMRYGDDDEYEKLSADMKTGNTILPNLFGGAKRYTRIPGSQDLWDQTVKMLATMVVDGAFGDSDARDLLMSGAEAILDSATVGLYGTITSTGNIEQRLNNIMSKTVFGALWGASTNLNYYGKSIVPEYLQDLPPHMQYDDTTNDFFIALGKLFGISPMVLQYAYEQYAGYGGQMLVSVMDGNSLYDSIAGAFYNRLTTDPAYHNDIGTAYAENKEWVNQFVDSVKMKGFDAGMLRSDLTDDQRSAAYEEAKAMLKKGGVIYETKQSINALWKQIDEVTENEFLSDSDKNRLILQYRDEMVALQLSANEELSKFKAKYVTGDAWFKNIFTPYQEVSPYTAYDKLDDTFKADEDKPYMQLARSAWEKTENESALPHPNTSFIVNKTTYEIGDDDWQAYTVEYKLAYSDYLLKNSAKWSILSDNEQVELLKEAHKKGHEAAKKWYMAKYGIKEKR